MFSGDIQILSLALTKQGLSFLISWYFLVPIFIIFLIGLFLSKGYVRLPSKIKELDINLGGIGSIKIKTNKEIISIAHKAWTELSTRKAGLLFDENHDVIIEIYDSWYEIFKEFRKLIKDIPGDELKDKNTQELIKVLVDSLNQGLRPHLTQWQSRFRKRYENQIQNSNVDLSAQDIQKQYPKYNELIFDLKTINIDLVGYTKELKKLIK